jgi:cytochrome b561
MLNNQARYGAVAMWLHWLIAAAIIYMIYLGLHMTEKSNFPPTPEAINQQFFEYQLHKSIGLTILGLSLVRLLWRFINVQPALPANMGWFERLGAHVSHVSFYAIMIGLPVTGWMMVSVSPLEIPTLYFAELCPMAERNGVGWLLACNTTFIEVPHLPAMDWPVIRDFASKEAAEKALKEVHKLLAYGTIGLLVLHVSAALYHALIKNDDVLARMLPFTAVGKDRLPL